MIDNEFVVSRNSCNSFSDENEDEDDANGKTPLQCLFNGGWEWDETRARPSIAKVEEPDTAQRSSDYAYTPVILNKFCLKDTHCQLQYLSLASPYRELYVPVNYSTLAVMCPNGN